MMVKRQTIGLVAALLLVTSCGKRQTEEEKKAEIQAAVKQALEDAKKEAAKPADAPGEAAKAAEPGQPAGAQPAGAQPAASQQAAAPPAPPPPPRQLTIQAGTPLVVRTTSSMSTKNAQAGNRFEASLVEPLVVEGVTLAKKGALVEGTVAESSEGGRVKGKAFLTLQLDSLRLADGRVVKVRTSPVTQEGKGDTKKNLVRGGIMTGAGAAIGALAGGGKGAAIGAGIGAGAGVGTAMATRGPAAQIPAETVMNFRTAAPVTVTEKR